MMTNNDTAVMEPPTTEKRPAAQVIRKLPVPAPSPVLARPPTFLTIDEVAAVLRCSVRSVYRLVDAGRILPPTRFGGLLRWNAAAFDAWIAEGAPPPYRPKPGRR